MKLVLEAGSGSSLWWTPEQHASPALDSSFSISGSCRSSEMSLSVSTRHTPLRGTQSMGLSHPVQESPGLATKSICTWSRRNGYRKQFPLLTPSDGGQGTQRAGVPLKMNRPEQVSRGSVPRIVTPRRLDNVYCFLQKSQ